ncbi:MAG TPA: hypothetical protein VGN07_04370 [Steroidobacteraceae bacterium]|jgi:hypothetical protein
MHEIGQPWLPVRAALHPAGLYLALRQIDPQQLRDAFMQETVVRLSAPETFVHIAREDVGKASPDTAPAGLIFHVARCGSTLLSQSLKLLDNVVVYAEPLPINEILSPPHPWPRHELVAALRSLGAALASHARRPYVIKFSSWNTLFCDIVSEAFPDSPWILSLRDPVEVGISLLQQPPGWFRDSGETSRQLAALVDPDGASKSPEEHVARLYGAFCNAATRLDTTRGKLIAYDDLPAAVWDAVAPHFSLSIDSRQRRLIEESSCNYAKAPVGNPRAFSPDAAAKQAAASAALHQAIDEFARPPLQRLERLHAL